MRDYTDTQTQATNSPVLSYSGRPPFERETGSRPGLPPLLAVKAAVPGYIEQAKPSHNITTKIIQLNEWGCRDGMHQMRKIVETRKSP